MVIDQKIISYLQVHIAVILFGFTAILGELIELSAIVLVWWRILLTVISLLFFIQFGKYLKNIPKRTLLRFIGIGFIIGLHWICFYGSLKLSNVSICLVSLSTTTFFTSFIEPLISKSKINKLQVFIGCLMIPGMILIVNNVDVSYYWGIIVGLLAALLASIFSVLNKVYIQDADPYTISFIELSGALLIVSIVLLAMAIGRYRHDVFVPGTALEWFWLILFAFFCTTLAQVLTLKGLKHLPAFTVNLAINLEPIYGIVLAIILFNEHKTLNGMFYAGASIIVLSVFLYPLIDKYLKPRYGQTA